MSGRFARNTGVPVEKSKGEIERMLTRYGATCFAAGWDALGASVFFEANGKRVRFLLPIPGVEEFRTNRIESKAAVRGYYEVERTDSQAEGVRAAEEKRRWRALALVIKAKLEAVESGIAEFEDEFLAHIVLPSGRTVGDHLRPQVEKAYLSGDMPPLLGMGELAKRRGGG